MDDDGEGLWLDAAQQRAWRAYLIGTTLLMDRLDRDLRRAHGISMPEYELLVRLSETPERRLRMAVLADALCYSRSRITHTVKRMQSAGLIERHATRTDGRGVEAVLTDHGYAVLVAAAPTHVRGVREHLVGLADAADFAAVGRVFDAVADDLLGERGELAEVTDIR